MSLNKNTLEMDNEITNQTALTATGAITYHPKRENISFGRWAMPVMAEKMHDSNASIRRRALQSLTDYVFDSRRVASKEFENVVPNLKALRTDTDDEVRLKVAECFAAIVATAAGRRVFLNNKFFKEVLELLNDEQEDIRFIANIVLQRFSILPDGAEALVEAGAIESLIKRIPNESEKVLVALLQALHSCCTVDPNRAVQEGGLQALTPLLDEMPPTVRAKASTVIKDLTMTMERGGPSIELNSSFGTSSARGIQKKKSDFSSSRIDDSGRSQASQLCAPLIKIATEEDDEVKGKALSALMMIVNSTEGKMAALDNAVVEKMLCLLRSNDPEVRINAIKVLTAVGETGRGKQLLLPSLNEIYPLFDDSVLDIGKAAKKLVAVIKLKP